MQMHTTQTLQWAGIGRQFWDQLVTHGLYPIAPPTRQGCARSFFVDDLVAVHVLAYLLDRDVVRSTAANIACQVHRLISADPTLEELTAWKLKPSNEIVVAVHPPQRMGIEMFTFDIAYSRAEAMKAMAGR